MIITLNNHLFFFSKHLYIPFSLKINMATLGDILRGVEIYTLVKRSCRETVDSYRNHKNGDDELYQYCNQQISILLQKLE